MGMKEFLKDVAAETDPVIQEWKDDKASKYGKKVTEDQVAVWRALKGMTDGDARKVVMSVKDEDGFLGLAEATPEI